MQTQKITDPDGVTRDYAFDSYDGVLFVKDAASQLQDPGRPYRRIYAAKKADLHALGGAHAEMWLSPEQAQAAIAHVSPQIGWRGAH